MNRKAWASTVQSGREADEAFSDLERRYAEAWRRYHGAEHVNECLELLDDNRDLAIDLGALTAAAYFHDAVYAPGARDNEALSAGLAYRSLLGLGWSEDRAKAVADLVLSTDHLSGGQARGLEGEDPDARLLHDIDLAVLGSPPERYARYAGDVRAEYPDTPDDAYALGRARVIERFLGSPSIFILPRFALLYESVARRNLAAELDALGAP